MPKSGPAKKNNAGWWPAVADSFSNVFGSAQPTPQNRPASGGGNPMPPLASRNQAGGAGSAAAGGGPQSASRSAAGPSRGQTLNGVLGADEAARSVNNPSTDSAEGCLAAATMVLLCGIKTEPNQKKARLVLMTLQNILLLVSTVFVLMTYLKLLSIKAADVYGSPNGKIEALFYDRQCVEDAGWLAGYPSCGHAMRQTEMAEGCALDPSLVQHSAPFPDDPTGNTTTAAAAATVTRLELAPHSNTHTHQHTHQHLLAAGGPTVLSVASADPAGVPGFSNGDVIRLNLSEPCKSVLGLTFLDVFSAPEPTPSQGGRWSNAVFPSPTEVEFTVESLPYPRPVPAGFSSPLVLQPAASQKLKTASGVPFEGTGLVLTGGFGGSTNATRTPPGVARAITNVKPGGPRFMDEMTIEFSEDTTKPVFMADWIEADLFFTGHGFSKTTSAAATWTDPRTLLIRFVEVGGPSAAFLPGATWTLVADTAFRASSDGTPFAGSFTWLAPNVTSSTATPTPTTTAAASSTPVPSATPAPELPPTPSATAAAAAAPSSTPTGDTDPDAPFITPSRIVIGAPQITAKTPFTPASVAFKDTPPMSASAGRSSSSSSSSSSSGSNSKNLTEATSALKNVSLSIGKEIVVRWVRGEEEGTVDPTSTTALVDVPSGSYIVASGETGATNTRALLALLGFPVPDDDELFAGIAARVAGLYYPVTWESRKTATSKAFSVEHAPGQGDHRWEIAFPGLTESNAQDAASFVASEMGLDPALVTVVPAEAENATETTSGAGRQKRAASEEAETRRARIKLSVRADAQRVDFLASRYGGPDPPAAEESVCADGAGGEIFGQFAIVCYFALGLIPLQVLAIIAHGYYEEIGCGCVSDRLRRGGGGNDTRDENGLSPGAVRIVCELLPRYVPDDAIEKLSGIVKAAAEREGDTAFAAKAAIWVDRAKRNKAAVCAEIYKASLVLARRELAAEVAVWKEKALRYWGWIVKLKAVVPVVITAFLDGTLMLHKVLDPATLVYDGDGIPVDWVQITMLCPMMVLVCVLLYFLFAWIAKRVLDKEVARDEKDRNDAARFAAMSEAEQAAETQRRRDEIRKKLEKKHKKDKKKVTDKMIDKYDEGAPMCTSGAWRTTAKGCLWTGVFFFGLGTLFGFYVKAVTAIAALTGKFGAGVQILLNLTDLAYVLLAVHLVVPKLVRPPGV